MTTPEPDPLAVDAALVAALRAKVRATDETKHPDEDLAEYLDRAKLDVDRRIGATTGIGVVLIRSWYVTVAAELFDRDKAPASNIPDRLGGGDAVVQQRSVRSPLQVIEREVRLWVPTW